MSFDLNNEKATNVLIWWVESSDGSIDFREEEAVKEVLQKMNYSLETYNQETRMHISGLSTEKVEALVDQSIAWGAENFDRQRKKITLQLLKVIAESDGHIEEDQQKKLDRIQKAFGVA